MSIKNLLDPEGENKVCIVILTNEEIFESIKEDDDRSDNDTDQNEPEELPVVRLSKKKMVAIILEALSYLHEEDNPDANKLSTLLEKYQQNILTEIHFHGRQANIVATVGRYTTLTLLANNRYCSHFSSFKSTVIVILNTQALQLVLV
ncbi:hypothetical protein Pst134EB_020376 [Puccinia striiformis f. sp. tritici]|uniref:Uncharacterized protein n=1 Tax=Puccinia striiformis f. sp. tritici PST-78 TaxID=1165861 RepID=A0A0L0W1A5_9BASI|nr:hypothetical protein Pst134EB_020376 [Puccinia striiformis f. sp. tritici]KNF05257.1 hypothetical protein PSTG_01471 [Puccinia striiformis f. sp. tritici PST-78]